ncbi:hypothetical protein HY469_04900 [Candidatus Roizmanbacteria bacterium]|nr:hypothetical protein [Candidatus Roizmanbacteria bacterium]
MKAAKVNPPQPVEPAVQPEPSHHKPIKIIIVAILLALAAFVGVVGYQIVQLNQSWRFSEPPEMMEPINEQPPSPAEVDMSDWQTYRNEKYGFEFDYPATWKLNTFEKPGTPEVNDSISIGVMDTVPPQKEGFGGNSSSSFFISNDHRKNLPENLTEANEYYLEYLTNYVPGISYHSPEVTSQEEIILDGYTAIRSVITLQEPSEYPYFNNQIILVYFPLNDEFWTIQLSGENTAALDQILSTFRFLDKSQDKIQILDGNAYLVQDGKQQLVANKDDFKEDSYAPPIIFTDAIVSPDQYKVLLIAQGGISAELLFYSDLNNVSFKYINTVSQAVWSHDSRYVAFTSKIADAGADYYLGIYDTNSHQTVDISKQSSINGIPSYSNIRWQEDDSGIIVHYTAQDEIPYGMKVGEGDITIPLTSWSQ